MEFPAFIAPTPSFGRDGIIVRSCRQRIPSRSCSKLPRRASVRMSESPFQSSPFSPSTSSETSSQSVVTDEMISTANRAADAAGHVIRRYFRASRGALATSTKMDESPVTLADREAEDAVRAVIIDVFPEHAILGEEMGETAADSSFTWIIDPIDGTKAFIAGRPTFGTLIALAHDGVPVLGVIDQPIARERWMGVDGRGTTLNGEQVSVAEDSAQNVANATVQATHPDMFTGLDAIAFRHLKRSARAVGYGSDCYAFALLATGCGDLVVEADLKAWDYAALVPVVQGAGGVMTDWYGRPLTLNSDGRVIAAANENVYMEALELLQSVDDPLASMQESAIPVSESFQTKSNGNGILVDPGPGHLESMTGFGSAIVGDGNVVVTAQLKSVNARYCDVQVRCPKFLSPFESQFVALVRQEAVRGKVQVAVEVTVDGEDSSSGKQLQVSVDKEALRAVRDLLEDVANEAGVAATPTISDILGFSDVLVKRDTGGMAEEAFAVALRAIQEALVDLRSSRRKEGALLEYDLAKRTRKLKDLLREIEMRAPQRVENQKARLASLTKDIASGEVSPLRIEYEITLFADRADITEEIVRLTAHISLFEMTLLGAHEPVGQRLTFLLQEMNREVTTIAAKALDAPIAQLGVLMKEEVEKMREQTQNIR